MKSRQQSSGLSHETISNFSWTHILSGYSSLSNNEHIPYLRKVVERDFHRLSMSEFEYLADAAEPDGWGLFFLYFLDLLVSIGLAVLMHKKDVFGDERRTAWRS